MGEASLASVLESLERGLHISLIASQPLITCQPEDLSCQVFLRPDCARIDQVPVMSGERVIGVLEKSGVGDSSKPARDRMRPLEGILLVATSTGILEYVHLAACSPYHLVVTGNRIDAIVTRSDLLKLPVRVVIFVFLTQLETQMTDAIRRSHPADLWSPLLNENRMQKVRKEYERAEKKNAYHDLLSFTQWCDKREILVKSPCSEGLGGKGEFEDDLKELEKLRNDIMHANAYLTDAEKLSKLVRRAEYWIRLLAEKVQPVA